MNIKTSKGKYRWRTASDCLKLVNGDLHCILAPTLPDGDGAKEFAISILDHIKALQGDRRRHRTILKWCRLVLDNYVASHHEVNIDEPRDLGFLTEYLFPAIPEKNWNADLRLSIKNDVQSPVMYKFDILSIWRGSVSDVIKIKTPKTHLIKKSPVKRLGRVALTLEYQFSKHGSRAHGVGLCGFYDPNNYARK